MKLSRTGRAALRAINARFTDAGSLSGSVEMTESEQKAVSSVLESVGIDAHLRGRITRTEMDFVRQRLFGLGRLQFGTGDDIPDRMTASRGTKTKLLPEDEAKKENDDGDSE